MALYLGSEKISSAPGTPGESATDTQVKTAVDNWFKGHPEATTTVADGSVTVKKLGIGVSVEYQSTPYFTGATPGIGSTAVYGVFGQVIPVEPGKTYYCSYNLSTQNITKVQILSAIPSKQFGTLTGVVGTIDPSADGTYTIPSNLTTAKAAFFPYKFLYMKDYVDEQDGVSALNDGTSGVKGTTARVDITRASGYVIQDVPFTEVPASYCQDQTASLRVASGQNQLLYASLYAAVSDLIGAKVAVLGDSLTEQSAASNQTAADKWMIEPYSNGYVVQKDDTGTVYHSSGWFAMIARKYMIDWYCAGHGSQWWYSTTARPNGATAMVRKLIDGDKDVDYVILEYGTNDILSGTLGTENDEASETATTTVGAVKWCIESLQTRFPTARIIVIMPCIHNEADGSAPAKQQTYINLIDPILRKYSVRRVYMSDDSGITKAMMPDGVHLRKSYTANNITYYTNDTDAVRRYSRCLEAELLRA